MNFILEKMFYLEACFIFYLQYYLGTPDKWTKLTKIIKFFSNNNRILFLSIFINIYLKINLFFAIFISKYINLLIKTNLKILRPYKKFNWLKYKELKEKNKDKSYSFPSNSVQNCLIFYGSLNNYFSNIYTEFSFLINFIFYIILFGIFFTRTIRALHYIHDIVFSFILAKSIMMVFDL